MLGMLLSAAWIIMFCSLSINLLMSFGLLKVLAIYGTCIYSSRRFDSFAGVQGVLLQLPGL